MTGPTRPPRPCGAEPYVGELVLVAFAAMGLQLVAMGYGQNIAGPPTYWFLVDFGLLMLVQVRRSEFARNLIIVIATGGAVLYAPGVLHGFTVLFAAFVIQIAALSTPPVRRHVRAARMPGPAATF